MQAMKASQQAQLADARGDALQQGGDHHDHKHDHTHHAEDDHQIAAPTANHSKKPHGHSR